jgi:hypothetical protein
MVTLLPMVIPVCHATCVPPPELLLLPPELLEPLPPPEPPPLLLLPLPPLLLAPELPPLPPPLLVLPPPLPLLLPPAPGPVVSEEEQPAAAARTDATATTKEDRTRRVIALEAYRSSADAHAFGHGIRGNQLGAEGKVRDQRRPTRPNVRGQARPFFSA